VKVVVDEGVPRQLVRALQDAGIDAQRFPPEWKGASNGDLIRAIEAAGFASLVRNDKNIADQQSLKGKHVSVIALPTNKRSEIVPRADDVADTIRLAKPGQHVVMGLDGSRKVRSVVDGIMVTAELPSLGRFRL
jgi:predicted nuclease of predicted toxin-antitoxin system